MLPDNAIPTRENCDLDDPDERFLWAFTSMPDMGGALLMLPNDLMRKLSKRLSQVGAMLRCPNCGHEEKPEIRWRMAPADPGSPFPSTAGEWVPADLPETERDVVAERLAQMGPHVKRVVAERLAQEFPDVFGPNGGDNDG